MIPPTTQLDAAVPPAARSEVSAGHSAVPPAVKGSYFSADLAEKDNRPRKTRTLLSLCVNQIGDRRALCLCVFLVQDRIVFSPAYVIATSAQTRETQQNSATLNPCQS